MVHVAAFTIQLAVDGIEGRLARDQSDGTAHGALTEQCALRPAKNLDPVDVNDPGVERHGNRSVVEIEPGGVVAEHATDGDRSGRRHTERVAVAARTRAR